jgi:hypothetical protein
MNIRRLPDGPDEHDPTMGIKGHPRGASKEKARQARKTRWQAKKHQDKKPRTPLEEEVLEAHQHKPDREPDDA